MAKPKIPSFEERYPLICQEINKRQPAWTLAAVSFDDVRQTILIRVFQKYETYDPRKDKYHADRTEEETFLHWVNRLISSAISNLLRDNLWKWSRPCIAWQATGRPCAFNTGADTCSKTASGIQCSECKAFKDWERRKINHFNVKQTLPLENHMREVDGRSGSDYIDIEGKKKELDKKIMKRLTKQEQVIYREVFIRGKNEKDVGKALKLRKVGRTHEGYQIILKVRHKAREIAEDILEKEGLF